MSSLIIAAAGAGKTTFLVKKALEISENVLITTYTDANEQSIRDKFYEINGCIPSNVTIMPWFSLLIKHVIRPYQSYLIPCRRAMTCATASSAPGSTPATAMSAAMWTACGTP